MNRYIITLICAVSIGLSSCTKSFLDIRSYDSLVGDEFWKNRNDVEMFMQGIYINFRAATTNSILLAASGDFRNAKVQISRPNTPERITYDFVNYLRQNDLNGLFNKYNVVSTSISADNPNNDWPRLMNIRNWSGFYEVIQKANIAIYEIEKLESSILSDGDKKRYIGEAKFVRGLCYFMMVRLYGDVPYYTEAFYDGKVNRENMLTVLENVIADVKSSYKDLPWTYSNQSIVGSRAMRGSAIALMMHCNMWLAGFTAEDKNKYYQDVVDLGIELDGNNGAYELLPMDRTRDIFQGRTKEGLFEITQNSNYQGEKFYKNGLFSFLTVGRRENRTHAFIRYDQPYLLEIYNSNSDLRKSTWFDMSRLNNTSAENNYFDLRKFYTDVQLQVFNYEPENNIIIFRLADTYLLRAEAYAELNNPTEAANQLTKTMQRAGLQAYAGSKPINEIKDDIWFERQRELFGEGHFFFDLVRTKKITDGKYAATAISLADFLRGAWTWPIDRSALINNPDMVLNTYWN